MVSPFRELASLARPDPAVLDRKLEDHRGFSAAMSVGCAFTALGLWLWDRVVDPIGARGTLPYRGLVFLLYLGFGLAMARVRGRRILAVLGPLQALAGEGLFVGILGRLEGGMVQGPGGFMYFFLVPLVLFQGLPLTVGLLYTFLAAALPHAMALAGLAPGFPHGAYAVLIWPACLVTMVAQAAFTLSWRRRHDLETDLERASNTDPLTGVGNRRHFARVMAREMGRSRRFRHPLAVLMVDIDLFKRVNDQYGHQVGDQVIRRVAEACASGSRESDVVARLGGEEFAVLLPEADSEGARTSAERIRETVEQMEWVVPGKAPVRCTVSLGLAEMRSEDLPEAFLRRADRALYRAKALGRNRVCCEGESGEA